MNNNIIDNISVNLIHDFRGDGGLETEWGQLFESSPTASPPLRWGWLREWWRVYGAADGHCLRVLAVRRGPRLIGALPLYLGRKVGSNFSTRRLGLVSTGESDFEATCAEYLDLLHDPSDATVCLDALRSYLLAVEAGHWDELDLPDISERSPLLAWGSAFERGRYRACLTATGSSPRANLTDGFEAYLGRLSSNTRQRSRRLLRTARAAGCVFEIASDLGGAETFFEQLVRLHQARWVLAGKPGAFASARFTDFHGALIRSWVPDGKAVLARLSLAGEPLAVLYGFPCKGKFDFYQSGVVIDKRGPVQSPGVSAHLMLMEHLEGMGITSYDFLRGDSPYKHRLMTDEGHLMRVRVVRRNVRVAADRASDIMRRVLARGIRLIRNPLNSLRPGVGRDRTLPAAR
jgi:CelD/BcsL family acetyltransferase involved in cellulose biosynthesis